MTESYTEKIEYVWWTYGTPLILKLDVVTGVYNVGRGLGFPRASCPVGKADRYAVKNLQQMLIFFFCDEVSLRRSQTWVICHSMLILPWYKLALRLPQGHLKKSNIRLRNKLCFFFSKERTGFATILNTA